MQETSELSHGYRRWSNWSYERVPIFDEDTSENKEERQDQKSILTTLGLPEIPTKEPLQYTGLGQGRPYKVLIDGGSTLNLVSASLCLELRLPTQDSTHVVINLPNGTTITSVTVCNHFSWKWEGVDITVGAYVVDITDWHIILRVKWLFKLGDFKCNYQNNLVQFVWKEQKIKISSKSTLELLSFYYRLIEVFPQWMG